MRMNTSMIDQGIQAGIAGSTVTLIVALAVQFPPVATTYAVKFCGAAAGVASTVSVARLDSVLTHGGEKVVMNPDVGKSSTPKQTLPEGEVASARLTLALSPTLMTTEDGVTVSVGPDWWILTLFAVMGKMQVLTVASSNAITASRE